ncbi:undecaprenyldiphospho-muramoylpentapeptide beta-N-acetylglucosaminyltransferase [Desulfovibrio inopinatus]|uniref:undecaprenyldiphospho-muramoylpentapeptide beta-N-acetylglucosaminyltransferase n=1 Tax=Desulfovibrio inopinatus TaxID=102109 RepID=UPI00041E5BAD|nr:undecaprenyldiphospho-muramoylpentapeptide beta-N-acetylglucosaminyltransferase [Desulfovibrio inopinatus]
MKRVVVTTGGTGGHIFPALAVARTLKERHPDLRILFIGASGPEKTMAEASGLEFVSLPVQGILGKGLMAKIRAAYGLGVGFLQAIRRIRQFSPQVVIGFGGYAGFIPVFVAKLFRIPTAIQEQNSIPGMANRVLSRLVDRIFLGSRDTTRLFPPKKCVLTGNPVRATIAALGEKARNRTFGRNVLVLGGSQGARAINRAVVRALPEFEKAGITLWHQTGKTDFDTVYADYTATGSADRHTVSAFIEDMAAAYDFADVVIARAGASSLAEITAAGKPAILIPFPHATHDHQMENALVLSAGGAARVVAEKGEKAPSLLADVNLGALAADLLNDNATLMTMTENALTLAAPHAADTIADNVEALALRTA